MFLFSQDSNDLPLNNRVMNAAKDVVLYLLGLMLIVLYISSFSVQQDVITLEHHNDKLKPATTTFYSDSYNNTDQSSESTFLNPIIELERYIQQHSQQSLQEDFKERNFAVAYYWCPQRVGNILHSFFNTAVWAMIHNRTLLVKYHAKKGISSEKDCQALLKRAEWLPLYDEWRDKLSPQQDILPVSLSSFDEEQKMKVVLYPQIPDVMVDNSKIKRVDWITDASQSDYTKYVQNLPAANYELYQSLYARGKEFLFGMLYDQFLTLQHSATQEVFSNVPENEERNFDSYYSLALHSRHTVGADDGSYIESEIQCLDQLLAKRSRGQHPCVVYIMSDRPKTINLLIEYLLTEQNCSAVVANHTSPGDLDIAEHGPWSGSGFLLDLNSTANANHGIVGDTHRSSTALVINSIAYHRSSLANEKLQICDLPKKPLSGYNYNNSPTFRHHSFIPKLEPIQLMERYQSDYRTLQQNQTYVVSYLNYGTATPEAVSQVLNSLLFAIISNRTFVLLEDCVGRICSGNNHTGLDIKAWLAPSEELKLYTQQNLTTVKINFDTEDTSIERVAPVLQLTFDQTRYSLVQWKDRIVASMDIDQLFARGQRFLYGLLFHETLDIFNRIDSLPFDISIVMEYSKKDDNLTACLKSILSREEEEEVSYLSTTNKKSCNIFALDFDNATNTTEKYPQEIHVGDNTCSISILNISSTITAQEWWRSMDLAANARSGWITSITSSNRLLTSFIQERMEYYRHRETWWLGRDPFYIPEFPICYYS